MTDLYERHYHELIIFAQRLGASQEDAEDLVQTAFVAMLGSYQERGQARAWLYQVVRCRWIDAHRKALRAAPIQPEPTDDPTARVLDRIEAAALLRRLPPVERRAIWLHFVEDCSLEETAARMGRSVGAIKGLCHRARARLTTG